MVFVSAQVLQMVRLLFVLAVVLGVTLSAVFYVVLPLFFMQKKPLKKVSPLSEEGGKVELSGNLENAFKSVSFEGDKLKLVRAANVNLVKFEVIFFGEKKRGDAYEIQFGEEEVVIPSENGDIKGVALAVKAINKTKIKSESIVFQKKWISILVHVGQAGVPVLVSFLLSYACALRLGRYTPSFIIVYILAILGILGGVVAFVASYILENKVKKEVK